jgi:hypothetical protein
MKRTKQLPRDGEKRSRKTFAWLPVWFTHYGEGGTPYKTMVWFEHYIIKEYWQYGDWNYSGKEML